MIEDFDQIGSSTFVQDLDEPVRTILADASGLGIVFPFWKERCGLPTKPVHFSMFSGPKI